MALNECYNTVGKEGYYCQGNRRKCGTGLCCGKVSLAGKTIRYSCEKSAGKEVAHGPDKPDVNYAFECIDERTKGPATETAATKLITAASAIVTASMMLS